MTIMSLNGKMAMHYLINSYNQNLEFEIPQTIGGKTVIWRRWLDTSLDGPCDICLWSEAGTYTPKTYETKSHSIAILFTKLD